jgi:hypothetical protein
LLEKRLQAGTLAAHEKRPVDRPLSLEDIKKVGHAQLRRNVMSAQCEKIPLSAK